MFHLKPSICRPLVVCRPGRSRHSPTPQLWYWRRLFSKTSRPALGPTRPPTQGVPWAFSPGELKLPRREADHWLPSSTEFNHSYPVPSFRMNGVIPPLFPYIFMACTRTLYVYSTTYTYRVIPVAERLPFIMSYFFSYLYLDKNRVHVSFRSSGHIRWCVREFPQSHQAITRTLH